MSRDRVVLVTDYTWGSTAIEAEVLAAVGASVVEARAGGEEELVDLVQSVDAVLTCFATVSARTIEAGRRLRVIGRYGIGVDNIDVAAATRLGIPVTNVPAYCLEEVAEHALALLLAGARNIVRYDRQLRQGDWRLNAGGLLHRVNGRRLGIVGFGKIGQTLAGKARAMGLRVLVHDRAESEELFTDHRVTRVSMEELLRQSDFVSLHVPLTPETAHLIDERALNRMKSTAILINTARGGLVDHDALVEAVRDRRIAGAAIDVFEPERLSPDHPLLALDNVIVTPHVAFYSEESVDQLRRRAAANVAAILSGLRPESVVNPEVLGLPRWQTLTTQSVRSSRGAVGLPTSNPRA